MTADPFDVLVIGGLCAGIKLRKAGITNFVTLENADDVIGSVFDDAAHAWTLTTRGGERHRARVVIASGTAQRGLTVWRRTWAWPCTVSRTNSCSRDQMSTGKSITSWSACG